jgi:chaperonin cofactor prefoldin
MRHFLWLALVCCISAHNLTAQSLMDAARKEAERRRQLAEQGIEAKVIEGDGRGKTAGGNVTTFTRETGIKSSPAQFKEPRTRIPASTYQRLLQKLDREIAECEERRNSLKRQAEAEKWSLPRVGRTGLRTGAQTLQERLRKQAEELEVKVKRLRLQRMETYEAGKKAGYLPGELDGKGITP